MSISHQSPQSVNPIGRTKTVNTTTWGSGGTTTTIADVNISTNSAPQVWATSVPAGRWAVTSMSQGTMTITSSDSEQSSVGISYILN